MGLQTAMDKYEKAVQDRDAIAQVIKLPADQVTLRLDITSPVAKGSYMTSADEIASILQIKLDTLNKEVVKYGDELKKEIDYTTGGK